MTLAPRPKSTPAGARPDPGGEDPSVLMDAARAALDEGRPSEAVDTLREAVRLSPFRNDARAMLTEALQARAAAGASPDGPREVRPARRRAAAPPLAPPEPEAPPARIEAIRFDRSADESGAPAYLAPIPVSPPRAHEPEERVPEPGPRPTSSDSRNAASPMGVPRPRQARSIGVARRPMPVARRPRRVSPLAWIAGIGAAMATTALLSAGAWLYFGDRGASSPAAELPPPTPAGPSPEELDRQAKEQAARYLEQSQVALAIERLESLSDPEQRDRLVAEVYASQGENFFAKSDWDAARKAFEEALRRRPGEARYAVELGRIQHRKGRWMQSRDKTKAGDLFLEAERYFTGALELDANSVQALEGLAEVETARGNRSAAVEHYKRLLAIRADGPEAERAVKALKSWGLKP